jgi:hypothetical protein
VAVCETAAARVCDSSLHQDLCDPGTVSVVASEKARHGLVREALADVLLERSAWVYARLHAGREYGVELHEETLTQDLLLDIAEALPDLAVRTFTTRQEASTGADWQWEWWFHGYRWFGIRVQAKRLKMLRNGQPGYDLGYLTGRRRERQVDLLVDGAHHDGLEPAYVLYNGPDLDLKFDWMCQSLPPSAAFFGVSFLPGVVAQQLVNAKTFDLARVGSVSRPWSCLVGCDPFGGCQRLRSPWRPWPPHYDLDLGEVDLAQWVARSFFRVVMQARYGREWGDRQERRLNQRLEQGLRVEPPAYVAGLLGGPNGDESWAAPRKVGAVTIFSAT